MTKAEFKQKCIELRLQNHTLGEIIQILKRPKTTIYYHIHKIPESDILKRKKIDISIRTIEEVRKSGRSPQKGKSFLGKKFKNFRKWTPSLINLVGHCLFDGQINQASVYYHNRSQVLIDNFKSKMKTIYDYEPILRLKEDDVMTIAYHNAGLAVLLKEKSEDLKEQIRELDKKCQLQFLKAFFDDEGCVTIRKRAHRKVRGYQYDDDVLYLIQKLLLNFEIKSKVFTKFHEIVITQRKNIVKFAKEINFTSGLRINGKRSNSIWKQDLEKREILQRAIDSYRPNYSELYSKYL
ncbi:MAG TPA: LAGLIDADG family homing endonuclease [Candidatus Paceibacterota bacterium]